MSPAPLRGLFISAFLSFVVQLSSQTRTSKQMSLPITPPTSGSEMFRAYCADCHGTDGRGGGPLVAILKVAPPDLTSLAMRNGGKFPYDRVYSRISGDKRLAAHGSREMPVWGPVFRSMGKGKQRIKALTEYLISLQPQTK